MKVLFIGNSHTYFNDMPHLFQIICQENGVAAETVMLSHGGKGLDFHKDQPEVRFNILYGGYDFVVLQHAAHPFGAESVMLEAGVEIHQIIKQTKAQTILYMTWSEKINEAGQARMANAYWKLAEKTGAKVAPVGLAGWKVYHQDPEIELYFTDGEHASAAGSKLAAYTLFSTIMEKRANASAMPDCALSQIAYQEAVAKRQRL